MRALRLPSRRTRGRLSGAREKRERCRELGADLAVDRETEDFGGAVDEWTEGRGVDVILDTVGAAFLDKNLKCAAAEQPDQHPAGAARRSTSAARRRRTACRSRTAAR